MSSSKEIAPEHRLVINQPVIKPRLCDEQGNVSLKTLPGNRIIGVLSKLHNKCLYSSQGTR